MPISTAPTVVPTRPSAVVKMEDRKRPAIADTDEYAPPSKRQAVNGGTSKAKEDPNGEYRDEAWLEVCFFPHQISTFDTHFHLPFSPSSHPFSPQKDLHHASKAIGHPERVCIVLQRAPIREYPRSNLFTIPPCFYTLPLLLLRAHHYYRTCANGSSPPLSPQNTGFSEGRHTTPDERIQKRERHIRSQNRGDTKTLHIP